MYRVQGLGECHVQNAGFRGALCTECKVQGCAVHRVQGVRPQFLRFKRCVPAMNACRDLLDSGATESKAVPCKHRRLLCFQVTEEILSGG